jgi:hypothetical protein
MTIVAGAVEGYCQLLNLKLIIHSHHIKEARHCHGIEMYQYKDIISR